MPLLGIGAWLGALAVLHVTWWQVCVLAVLSNGLALARRSVHLAAFSVAAGAVIVVGLVDTSARTSGAVADLGEQRAVVELVMTTTSDARPVHGRYADLVVLRARVSEIEGRGRRYAVGSAVSVFADPSWERVPLGTTVRTTGRLATPQPGRTDSTATLSVRGPPEQVLAEPSWWWDAAAAVRASLRAAVVDRGPPADVLVPSLVVGDDARLDAQVAEDFRTTGLTHLLAVSGTNLTLVVGAVLLLARWAGVRGRWLHLIGGLAIAGFVLLARTEPSVVRAAVMGAVGLVAMMANGTERGLRCLGVAVLALLLSDPRWAVSPGFALSVLATGGILLLAPRWRDAMTRWLPRWLAEALSVPLAAQVACTPVVAALSGEVSLVAVAANLAAAPAVAPATVLGLAGGLAGLVSQRIGEWIAWPAAWAVCWIATVAEHGADLPMAALSWGTGPLSLLLLVIVCLLGVLAAPLVLRSPWLGTSLAMSLVVVVLVRPATPGWPPAGWVVVACDVGQGDALVLNGGGGRAVVVDAGPDPAPVKRCLDDLDIRRVPLVVLTHFHADHVDGLSGVLAGREVGGVLGTPLLEPERGIAQVTADWGTPPALARFGAGASIGPIQLQVLWPRSITAAPGESAANDASVVLLAEVADVRILLTGDIEPTAQTSLQRLAGDLQVDVLKVPHHGSSHQDEEFLTGLGASAALVSVGADNDYGHPSQPILDALTRTGTQTYRTDLDGDIAVVVSHGELSVRTRD